jgi:hypothetical protein
MQFAAKIRISVGCFVAALKQTNDIARPAQCHPMTVRDAGAIQNHRIIAACQDPEIFGLPTLKENTKSRHVTY